MKSKMTSCFILGLAVLSFFSAVCAQSTEYLDPHNDARESLNAGIPDLVWDDTLTTYATNWAQHQADQDSCNLVHSEGPYGENIYWSSGSSTPGDAVAAWVAEQQYYDYDSNSCASGEVCGHYTQVVWRDTARLGCGSATCSGGGTFVVCSYDPPGNVGGRKSLTEGDSKVGNFS